MTVANRGLYMTTSNEFQPEATFISQSGFSLLELMVVMSIISVLAGVALPMYQSYRAGAFDSRAQVVMRSVASAEEAYFIGTSEFRDCDQSNCHLLLTGVKPIESGITLQAVASATGFVITASHRQGT